MTIIGNDGYSVPAVKRLRYANVAQVSGIDTSSWSDLFAYTGAGILYGAVFHFNTEKMDLRLSVDGLEVFELDLREIRDDFHLGNGNKQCPRWIYTHSNLRFVMELPVPVAAEASITIQARSHSGNKKMNRGLVVYNEF